MRTHASRLLSFGIILLTSVVLSVSVSSAEDNNKSHGSGNGGGKKVCLCHVPPGNPANAHTICVGKNAARAHLRHHDVPGECVAAGACGGQAEVACPDGQFCDRPNGTCDPHAEGRCAPVPADCPTIIAPVCGCDGTTYSNACYAAVAGVGVASAGECAAGVACGGAAGGTCDAGSFCKHADGVCAADADGVCTVIPSACPAISAPVCGCDGVTYDNACLAATASTGVSHAGACEPVVQACGAANPPCPTGQFCKKADGACDAQAEGACQTTPGVCPAFVDPVCGCDGKTYSNPCLADANGVTISHAGACTTSR